MNQHASSTKCQIYTIQPGDGTRYTFSIAEIVGFTRQYTAIEKPDILRPGNTYQHIINMQSYTAIPSHHFAGYGLSDPVYLVSIFSPSNFTFTVSKMMLDQIYNKSSGIAEYLFSKLTHVDLYTFCVVLAFTYVVRAKNTFPSKKRMQEALINARDINDLYSAIRGV